MSQAITKPRGQRSGNRERIIEAAIELINLHGANIGTAQIAEHTGISPGNIYYYFNNFSEIALEIVNQLRSELLDILALPAFGPVMPAQAVNYYCNGGAILWRYRFVISAGHELAHRSPELENSFRELTNEGIEAIRRLLDNLFEHNPGPVRVDRESCDYLAESMWVLWSAWPRHAEIRSSPDQTSPQEIARGLQKGAFMLAPYIDESFYRQVDEGLAKYISNLDGPSP
ncbi:MAG: TetR/AcrR family transcriptional regulator [Parvularculales bacterium]